MRLKLSTLLTKPELLATSAAERWKIEHSGTYMGPMPLRTDEVSQSKVNGAITFLNNEPAGTTIKFKGPVGWVELDLPNMLQVALAVGRHVQLCFAKEEEVDAAINATPPTITLPSEIVAAYATIPSPGFDIT